MKPFQRVRPRLKSRKFAFGPFSTLIRGHAPPALPRHSENQKPEAVPASMAGRYVVWSADGLRMIGHGRTIAEAREMAGSPGDARLVIQKIPAVRRFRPTNGGGILPIDKTEAADPAKV